MLYCNTVLMVISSKITYGLGWPQNGRVFYCFKSMKTYFIEILIISPALT